MDHPINHLSLCTGFAGIDLGIKRVLPTCRTITYVEIEAFAIANLVDKMEKGHLDSAPVWTDLRTFDGKPYRGKVDVISGGFPCQPFSAAGNRLADADPRHLFPTIKRIIREVRPGLVFLENVEGIITSKLRGQEGTSVLLHVLGELESLGFTATWGMFSAAEVGAPHRRNRVFIAAVANSDSGRLEGFSKRHNQDKSDAQGINPDRCNKGLADTMCQRSPAECSPRQVDQEGWSPQVRHTSSSCKVQRDIQQGGVEQEIKEETITPTVADTNSCRGGKDQQQGKFRSDRSLKSPINSRRTEQREAQQIQKWPAIPGQVQHSWEKPRTIEPRMGGTVDGNTSGVDMPKFRVDRLRLLGNGVVPATAEVAFRTLFTQLREETQ